MARVPAKAVALILSGISIAPKSAQAQVNGFGTRQRVDLAQPPVHDRPAQSTDDRKHLFNTWGGARTWLLKRGVDFVPIYILEAAGNTSGGVSQGSAYTGRLGLSFETDWQKLAGVKGLRSHILFLSKSGRDLSADHLGNDPYSVTELYGRIGVLARLQFAYLSEDLNKRHLQLAAGRMNQAFFFNTSPLYCMFLSLAICAVPRALTGANPNGFNSNSRTNWGSYIRYRPISAVYIQVGAFEVSTLHGGISGLDWSSSNDVGINVPFQVGWEPGGGRGERPSHFALGGYYDSGPYQDINRDTSGQARGLSGLPGRSKRNHTAFWAQLDHMLKRNTQASAGGLVMFANLTRTDPRLSAYRQQLTLGFEDVGEFASRPNDGFGVQVTYAWVSQAMKARQQQYHSITGKYLSGLYGNQSFETVIEAQYSFHIRPGVDVQPDFQYIIHPNSQSALSDAVVLAGRARVNF